MLYRHLDLGEKGGWRAHAFGPFSHHERCIIRHCSGAKYLYITGR